MVWIYGGGFNRGSGNTEVYGPEFLVAEDVVIVTINYPNEHYNPSVTRQTNSISTKFLLSVPKEVFTSKTFWINYM
jgi:Carboxylesterase type B